MLARLRVACLSVLLAAGCGGGDTAPENVWTWVDLPDARCSDGSATGVGVNSGSGDTVVLFLDGGGACWDTLTCFRFETAAPGPFGPAQLDARLEDVPGSILDRTLAGAPFADATLVFVPYCTGDVHMGDATQRYPDSPREWRHHGKKNLEAALAWIGANLAAPAKVVVSGASAGGFGALFAFDLVSGRWPGAKGYLLDDSGPPLVGDDFNPLLRAAWFISWRLDETLLPICPECARDLSELLPALARRHPTARLGLLSSREDQVIRSYVALSPAGFERALLQLEAEVVAPLPGAAMFLVPGEQHTMLGAPGTFTAGEVPLLEWIGRMVADDPGWRTEGR
jgi:hypothetical protein